MDVGLPPDSLQTALLLLHLPPGSVLGRGERSAGGFCSPSSSRHPVLSTF